MMSPENSRFENDAADSDENSKMDNNKNVDAAMMVVDSNNDADDDNAENEMQSWFTSRTVLPTS